MFTFGIFTTHIPYIAFVVFYAYFLLFGINKASSGEIAGSEQKIIYTNSAVKYIDNTDGHASYFNFIKSESDKFKHKLTFNKEIRTWYVKSVIFKKEYFCNSDFCRPPPHF
ncbi:MAG: hypothetical protein JXR31_10410 [Prolixibacteraceae bacterium]|nr:hypothetical protein [Prolixibacteraceae bacterium]MBN2774651.1 hypothetical protein [Prolixibacteraceae bacterium]